MIQTDDRWMKIVPLQHQLGKNQNMYETKPPEIPTLEKKKEQNKHNAMQSQNLNSKKITLKMTRARKESKNLELLKKK